MRICVTGDLAVTQRSRSRKQVGLLYRRAPRFHMASAEAVFRM